MREGTLDDSSPCAVGPLGTQPRLPAHGLLTWAAEWEDAGAAASAVPGHGSRGQHSPRRLTQGSIFPGAQALNRSMYVYM